jgi:hypothetical protein
MVALNGLGMVEYEVDEKNLILPDAASPAPVIFFGFHSIHGIKQPRPD